MNREAIEHAAGEWYELGGEVGRVVIDPVVREWRYESLIRASFTANQARIVCANADIDVHWLIDLTRQGCPHATACRIAGLNLPDQVPSRTLAPV